MRVVRRPRRRRVRRWIDPRRRLGAVARAVGPLPRPKTWLFTKRIRPRRRWPISRRGPRRPVIPWDPLEARAVPLKRVYGTLPERILYRALERRGIPFDFQSSVFGGRIFLGGMVADFVLLDRAVVIRVQGRFWHSRPATAEKDEVQKNVLEMLNYDVLDIDEFTIYDAQELDLWIRRYLEEGHPQSRLMRPLQWAS